MSRRTILCASSLLVAFLLLLPLGSDVVAQGISDDDCMTCHDDLEVPGADGKVRNLTVSLEAYRKSAHGKGGELGCLDCHMDIESLPHGKDLMTVRCDGCHRTEKKTYATSVHAHSNETAAKAEGATCADCHGVHDVLPKSDPASRINHHNLAATCIRCHEDQVLIDRHDEMPGAEYVESYTLSVHGRSNEDDPTSHAATCTDCHGWHDTQSTSSPDSSVSRGHLAETCSKCHTDVVAAYFGSVHGDLAKAGNPDVPVCSDCHGEHKIRSPEDRQSTVSRFNIAETCARCHEDPRITKKYDIPIATPTTFYRKSVHGQALLVDRNENAAACHDCHGHHEILGGADPRSKVNRLHIPDTCGNCHQHQDILKTYLRSVHGKAMKRGIRESPVCTDCHGEHTIMSHLDPDSPVYPTRLAKEVCGRCHDSVVMNRKYGLTGNQVSTYYESYHGLASKLGDTDAANCASCHGVHDILPQDDVESSINPRNLAKTCGKCHPGAGPEFIKGLVHSSPLDREGGFLYWLRRVYLLLIVLTIGGMLLHNVLIVVRHVRDKYRAQHDIPHVVRFPSTALVQHLLLSVFFILLVITGFSLSFPDSLFSRAVGKYLGLGEGARGTVHRISGVGLMATVLWHMITIFFTRRGRRELGALMIRFQDLKDAIRNMAFHLGLAKEKPRFERYDYSEKMEYWALMWGVLIMAVTGLIMWFPVQAASWLGLGKSWSDAANVVHYYEAWLATLAIAVWHLFFVMFHPEEYPMSLSWLTGKLPVEAMEERHPKELERLKAAGEIVTPAGHAHDTPTVEVDSPRQEDEESSKD